MLQKGLDKRKQEGGYIRGLNKGLYSIKICFQGDMAINGGGEGGGRGACKRMFTVYFQPRIQIDLFLTSFLQRSF